MSVTTNVVEIEGMKVFKIPHVAGFTATNVVSREECADLVATAEASGFKWSAKARVPILLGTGCEQRSWKTGRCRTSSSPG
jgi:hypothetical protein